MNGWLKAWKLNRSFYFKIFTWAWNLNLYSFLNQKAFAFTVLKEVSLDTHPVRERNVVCAEMNHRGMMLCRVAMLQHYNSGSIAFEKCCEYAPLSLAILSICCIFLLNEVEQSDLFNN